MKKLILLLVVACTTALSYAQVTNSYIGGTITKNGVAVEIHNTSASISTYQYLKTQLIFGENSTHLSYSEPISKAYRLAGSSEKIVLVALILYAFHNLTCGSLLSIK